MNENFSEIIVDRFSSKFAAAYKKLKGNGKPKILKYSPVIFKRWYYSALIDETTLSPSFIYGASLGVNSPVSAPSVKPQFSGTSFKGFSAKKNSYTVSNHPVTNDLQILMDFCMPDVELDGQNHIVTPVAEKISKFLSLGDPYYVDYLTEVAFELKLLKKAAAIYSNKAVAANNYTLFKKLNQEEALKKIVEASIRLCSKNINAALPSPVPFVSEKGITSLIKNPISIDEIYKKIFGSFGVDIEQLWNKYDEKSDSREQNSILSSTFFLGVILDKWFITSFSEYLKIIEPIYCFCYNFDDELDYLFSVIKSDGVIDTALFSPCAFYSFTPFGKILFASNMEKPDKRQQTAIPVSELLGLLDYEQPPSRKGYHDKMPTAKEVFSFKVKLADDKRCWRQIDAADYNTLHELHAEIALSFVFGLSKYRIYTDESMNPFCELRSPEAKDKKRKADKVTIGELDLSKGKKMIYISDTGKELEIELVKKTSVEDTGHYPQTVKTSKRLQAQGFSIT